ncbi:MAG: hypothetical protein ACYCWW_13350 [Deltaproteobacteria bacterium]
MRRLLYTLAPVAVGTALCLGASPAQSAPTRRRLELPELLLPAPKPAPKPNASADAPAKRVTGLGDYPLPGRSADEATASRAASSAALL